LNIELNNEGGPDLIPDGDTDLGRSRVLIEILEHEDKIFINLQSI